MNLTNTTFLLQANLTAPADRFTRRRTNYYDSSQQRLSGTRQIGFRLTESSVG